MKIYKGEYITNEKVENYFVVGVEVFNNLLEYILEWLKLRDQIPSYHRLFNRIRSKKMRGIGVGFLERVAMKVVGYVRSGNTDKITNLNEIEIPIIKIEKDFLIIPIIGKVQLKTEVPEGKYKKIRLTSEKTFTIFA